MDMSEPSRRRPWFVLAAVVVVLVASALLVDLRGVQAAAAPPDVVGQPWREVEKRMGSPVCRVADARITSRESAARRAKGRSSLVVPHAELVVVQPTAVHGHGSRVSNRTLIVTGDADARAFLIRHASGDLAGTSGETRIAIGRPQEVYVVELDPRDRVASVRSVRPVFLTVVRR